MKQSLADMDIPLYVVTHPMRKTLPRAVLSLMSELNATHLFANIEHEVDELRRDLQMCQLAKEGKVTCTFAHDKCIITPGTVKTKEDKTYTVNN